ncbi:hypothetical protein ACJJTC_000077 [Scirpophaga incertulas]
MEWSEEKCLTLIELYRNNPVLWDPQDANFKNKNLKEDAWVEIGRGMDISGEMCKNKMKILLSGFRREKSKQKKSSGTGKGASEIYRSNWFAFEALSFLMDRDKPRLSLNTVSFYLYLLFLPATERRRYMRLGDGFGFDWCMFLDRCVFLCVNCEDSGFVFNECRDRLALK